MCTDGVMPGTPTRHLIKRLLECHPGRPVVVCSGHAPGELHERGIDLVAHTYMGKPLTGTELIARVRQLISAQGEA